MLRRPGFPRTSNPGELQRPKCGARSAAPRQRRASSDARERRPSSGPGQHPTNGAREATHKQRHPRGRHRQRPISDARSTMPDQRRSISIARSASPEQLHSSAIQTARNKRRAASERRRPRSAGTADPEARKGGHWGRTSGGRREREPRSEEGGRGHARAVEKASLWQVGLTMHAGSTPAHDCRLNFDEQTGRKEREVMHLNRTTTSRGCPFNATEWPRRHPTITPEGWIQAEQGTRQPRQSATNTARGRTA